MSTHSIRIAGRTRKVALTPGEPPVVDGERIAVEVRELSPGVLSLLLTAADGTVRSLRAVAESSPGENAVLLEGQRFPYVAADPRSLRATQATGSAESGPRPLKAPMPGRVVRILVADGEPVQAGQGCIVIEAMKMQNELKAPRAGTVSGLSAAVGETVAANTVLLVIE